MGLANVRLVSITVSGNKVSEVSWARRRSLSRLSSRLQRAAVWSERRTPGSSFREPGVDPRSRRNQELLVLHSLPVPSKPYGHNLQAHYINLLTGYLVFFLFFSSYKPLSPARQKPQNMCRGVMTLLLSGTCTQRSLLLLRREGLPGSIWPLSLAPVAWLWTNVPCLPRWEDPSCPARLLSRAGARRWTDFCFQAHRHIPSPTSLSSAHQRTMRGPTKKVPAVSFIFSKLLCPWLFAK